MNLELDVGNTRVKWRMREQAANGLWRQRCSGVTAAALDGVQTLAALREQLAAVGQVSITRVLISSVRKVTFNEELYRLLKTFTDSPPQFAMSARACAGVTNAYADPHRLGVDRWLAMLAAYAARPGASCVLDCGTTITLDLLAADGKHLGGYIVPGLMLMREALGQRSEALVVTSGQWQFSPGTNTEQAIMNGLINMVLGFVRDQHARVAAKTPDAQWYLTGGDAELIGSNLDWSHNIVPDLVLDGLQLALPANGMSGGRL